jgi:hypothetical protein
MQRDPNLVHLSHETINRLRGYRIGSLNERSR